MNFLRRLSTLLSSRLHPTTPLVEVGIAREALLHNFRTYQKAYPGIKLAPVLKSNAYGHDLGLIARALDQEPLAFFMVDSLYEARKLRTTGVRSRILVLGYTRPEDIASCPLRMVDFAITDLVQLRTLARLVRRPIRIHLKLDTGMHRQGITPDSLHEAMAIIQGTPALRLVGVCSHFADADTEGSAHAARQLTRWKEMSGVLVASFPGIEYRHLAATKGMRFAEAAGTNVARLGIGLYGFDTAPESGTALRPVLELRSIIGSLREIPAGESVGYNASFTTTRTTHIATVPAGYYEGVDRRLSNCGFALVRGIACPIIGRISMNMTTVDVTRVPDVSIGDTVTLISRERDAQNTVPAIASMISTPLYRESEYVVLTHIPQHLKRVLE